MLLKSYINNVLEYYIKHLIALNTSVERKKEIFCFMVIVVVEQKQWSWEKKVVGVFFFKVWANPKCVTLSEGSLQIVMSTFLL